MGSFCFVAWNITKKTSRDQLLTNDDFQFTNLYCRINLFIIKGRTTPQIRNLIFSTPPGIGLQLLAYLIFFYYQLGGGYPGHEGCNNVIPHCKWHAQTAASLSDMTRLMDFVLHLENKHTN